MGTFVPEIDNPAFEWGIGKYPLDNDDTKDLIESRYVTASGTAQEMLDRLVGTSGDGGLLGELNSIIVPFVGTSITAEYVNVPGTSVDFTEGTYDSNIIAALIARLTQDLVTGATGLNPTVEQDIYDRALARQAVENDKVQVEIEDYFSTRGFDLPTGAMAGRIYEQANDISRNNTDINGQIMKEQADLAQKNSQFIIDAAIKLETVLRSLYDGINNRALEFAKVLSTINVEEAKAKIANAELQLRALITSAEIQVSAYSAEYGLREKVATSEANVAMQTVASAYGSLNMSVGMSYSSGIQHQESVSHSESRQMGFDMQQSLSESHSFEEEAGV